MRDFGLFWEVGGVWFKLKDDPSVSSQAEMGPDLSLFESVLSFPSSPPERLIETLALRIVPAVNKHTNSLGSPW